MRFLLIPAVCGIRKLMRNWTKIVSEEISAMWKTLTTKYSEDWELRTENNI